MNEHAVSTISRLVNLVDPAKNLIFNMLADETVARVQSGDLQRIREIDGHFAIAAQDGLAVRMARSLGRPMRYFLAKQSDGPFLIVAERIDAIREVLQREGLADQFHPSYTRMVPAHYLVEIALVGCPDPNPGYRRFFTPPPERLPADLDGLGRAYLGAVAEACDRWLDRIGPREPIGVLFSGGVDSGCVFLVLYHLLLRRGESPCRLKAFTLSVQSPAPSPQPLGPGADTVQAREFLDSLGLGMFLETIEVAPADVDYRAAVRAIEDYKPLDVQAAAVMLALCAEIRKRYPEWRHLVDGDGGDENLKDYPIEEDPELTIRSVLNNRMLYHEGWGVDAVKHSLTYSGGLSRGCVRSFAPARLLGFEGFSPFTLPRVIEVAERIPFIELTDWQHDRLYALKGELVRRGVQAITGLSMPVAEKRRFQRGAMNASAFAERFPVEPSAYRRAFAEVYG